MAKVKAGVVGAGRMGEYHVGVLSEMQGVELAWVVDVDPERRKAIQGIY
ncbi:MAG: gfo/Idh/MocA family oxidoreductase, partial [Nitrospinae bacterium]|nr:gfo/Idh/MocA family oxidoreductase [Nitrospinota bacterium]